MVLHFLPACPEMCCLLNGSRWVKRCGLRGCKSISPHYYCRVRCGWWRADIAILWVRCLRSLSLGKHGVFPDPVAWINEDWKTQQPEIFSAKGFLLFTRVPTILVRPHHKVMLVGLPSFMAKLVLYHYLKLRVLAAQQLRSRLCEFAPGERTVAAHDRSAEKRMSE